ncbi:MAG TPA: CAP domain-containing protein [Kineosporiaceae bacterium]|nr:CAP domain-containing protein [Kineosporiaceae bacterium]
MTTRRGTTPKAVRRLLAPTAVGLALTVQGCAAGSPASAPAALAASGAATSPGAGPASPAAAVSRPATGTGTPAKRLPGTTHRLPAVPPRPVPPKQAPPAPAAPPASAPPAVSASGRPVAKGAEDCVRGTMRRAAGAGRAPVQYASGWTAAPTRGCTVTDAQGRTVRLTAVQNRMLYRVNEMRMLQNAKDSKRRAMLYPDFCLTELAQGYAASNPAGHNPLLMKMYPFAGGRGSATGSSWINENLGAHGGYTNDPMAAVDRLVYNWFTSGTLQFGHYGNMMNPTWRYGGMGVVIKGSSALGIQNFSHSAAMYTYPTGKGCSRPPAERSGDSTVPPIGDPPRQ